MPYALDKVPQFEGSVSDWAEKMTRYLERQTSLTQEVQPRSILLTHQIDSVLSRATVDGLLMYSPVDASPVASIGGAWVPLIGPGYYGNMVWSGQWAEGTYPPNHVVTDWPYLMISNKETDDRPAPQGQGSPEWAYLGTSPTGDITAKELVLLTYYTFLTAAFLVKYRIYTVEGNTYSTYYQANGGAIVEMHSFTADTTGWRELTTAAPLMASGTELTAGVRIHEPAATPITVTLSYNYTTPNNDTIPAAGDMVQSNKTLDSLRVATFDQSGDQSAFLATMTTGDSITGAGKTWVIQAITDNGTWYDFTVAPAQQGSPQGVQDFEFETVTATPITTVIDPNYWSSSPNIYSAYAIDGGTPIQSETAYGVDIEVQDAYMSPDWDIMAISDSTAGDSNGSLYAGVTSVVGDAIAGVHAEVVPGDNPVLTSDNGIASVIRITDAHYVVSFIEPRPGDLYHVDISPQSNGTDIITPVIYDLTNSYFSVKFMGGAPGQPKETPPVAFTVRIT